MPMSTALRICPTLLIVPHHFSAYRDMSAKVMAILRRFTPDIEQISIDEAFLDVSREAQAGANIAQAIQQAINRELSLPCSLGVASNKLVAKIANNIGKAARKQQANHEPPNAIQVVDPGAEAAFLAPLPIRELWGVGPKTEAALHELGIKTIGDIAAFPVEVLAKRFGKHGADLSQHARGIDDRPLEPVRATKSVSRETTFVRDVHDPAVLQQTLHELAQDVAEGLRKEGLFGTTVKIKLRWSDFRTVTGQLTLPIATAEAQSIEQAGRRLLDKHWTVDRAVRLIGIGVSHFITPTQQLPLFQLATVEQSDLIAIPSPIAAQEASATIETVETVRLKAAVEGLQQRFGQHVVQRGKTNLTPKR
jgi:nucleotidyltransferase/DNA polymerase involved in DNA repair